MNWHSFFLTGLFWTTTPVYAFHAPSIIQNGEASSYGFPNYDDLSPSISQGNGLETWVAAVNQPIKVEATRRRDMKIFCRTGPTWTLRRLWYTASFILNITEDSFHLYRGTTTEEVQAQYKAASRFFSLLPWRDRVIPLKGFAPSSTCIGVYTSEPYTLTLKVYPVDPLRLATFAAGVILLLCARTMSRNTAFHYSSVISIALVGSLLVVIFLLGRMIPGKRFSVYVSFLVSGWAMVLYFFRAVWSNFRENLSQHRHYVACYVAAVSAVTFLLMYRFGGVRNPRTMDLLQWTMQFVGAVLIYVSCTIETAGAVLVAAVAGLEFLIHRGYVFRRIRLFNWLFPPRPRKLISSSEYESQGRRETERALQELRKYCNSPECKTWSLTKRLNNPQRVSLFVDEGVHLLQDEVDFYERDLFATDDDQEDDTGGDDSPPVVPTSNGRTFADRFGGRGLLYRNSSRNLTPQSTNGDAFRRPPAVNRGNRTYEPMDFE